MTTTPAAAVAPPAPAVTPAGTGGHTPYFDPTIEQAATASAARIHDRNRDPERLATRVRDTYESQNVVALLKSSLTGLRERTQTPHCFLVRDNLCLTEYGFRSMGRPAGLLNGSSIDSPAGGRSAPAPTSPYPRVHDPYEAGAPAAYGAVPPAVPMAPAPSGPLVKNLPIKSWRSLRKALPLQKDESLEAACRSLDTRLAECVQNVEGEAVTVRRGYRGRAARLPFGSHFYR